MRCRQGVLSRQFLGSLRWHNLVTARLAFTQYCCLWETEGLGYCDDRQTTEVRISIYDHCSFVLVVVDPQSCC